MTERLWHTQSYIKLPVIISILLFFPLQGCQKDNSEDDEPISVEAAWTRPYNAEAGISTAVYLTIHNRTSNAVKLTHAYIPLADTVEIHQSIQQKGIMRMKPAQYVIIDAKKSLAFEPGGHHMMVKGLQRSLEIGDSLNVTLGFADGQSVKTTALTMWER